MVRIGAVLLALVMAVGATGVLAEPPAAAAAAAAERLFAIRRSLNGNRVAYDVARKGDGFDAEDPIRAYWLLEKGGTEELSGLERRFAYGFEVSKASPNLVRFSLEALPDRPIEVRREGGKVVAVAKIGGEPCSVDDIFVQVGSGLFFPSVDWVKLSGRSLKDGKVRFEKIEP